MKRTIAALMLCAGILCAQTATPPATPVAPVKKVGKIATRKENQQDRIAQGVKSGQLTAGQTARLETKDAKINREVRMDRKANGGNLTNNEKKVITRQQNNVGGKIYKDKHDSVVQPK